MTDRPVWVRSGTKEEMEVSVYFRVRMTSGGSVVGVGDQGVPVGLESYSDSCESQRFQSEPDFI